MPRRHSLPRRRRLAKSAALAEWNREHRATEPCSMVHSDGKRCRGIAVCHGYCRTCWGDAA